jgi:gliding motility-associated-like protein
MMTSISLNVNPIADFNYTILPVCEGFGVEFSDSSELTDTYSWFFGDGSYSNEKDPYHVFEYNSNTRTSLVVGNKDVCYDTLTINFNWQKISDVIDVFVPNIITPNSDGFNDCFEITVPSEFESCTSFIVYNRWGMKVFDSVEFHQNFCGYNAYNNKALSEGTYFYTIKVGAYDMNGFVSIVK